MRTSTGHTFISHANMDDGLAFEISGWLHNLDVPVWRDFDVSWSGLDARTALRAAIRSSSLFVVLMTRLAIKRRWVAWEVSQALRCSSLAIVPVYQDLDWFLLPSPFDRLADHDPIDFEARDEFERRVRNELSGGTDSSEWIGRVEILPIQ